MPQRDRGRRPPAAPRAREHTRLRRLRLKLELGPLGLVCKQWVTRDPGRLPLRGAGGEAAATNRPPTAPGANTPRGGWRGPIRRREGGSRGHRPPAGRGRPAPPSHVAPSPPLSARRVDRSAFKPRTSGLRGGARVIGRRGVRGRGGPAGAGAFAEGGCRGAGGVRWSGGGGGSRGALRRPVASGQVPGGEAGDTEEGGWRLGAEGSVPACLPPPPRPVPRLPQPRRPNRRCPGKPLAVGRAPCDCVPVPP